MSPSFRDEAYFNETLLARTELQNELFRVSHSLFGAISPSSHVGEKMRSHCFRLLGLETHGTGIRESTKPRREGRVQLELSGFVVCGIPHWFVFVDFSLQRDRTFGKNSGRDYFSQAPWSNLSSLPTCCQTLVALEALAGELREVTLCFFFQKISQSPRCSASTLCVVCYA